MFSKGESKREKRAALGLTEILLFPDRKSAISTGQQSALLGTSTL